MNVGIVDLYQQCGLPAPDGARAELQIFLPHIPEGLPAERTRPAVLVLPGGGYEHVSEREAEPIALQFVARGYAAFVLTYSVAPHKWPVALREAAMAMAYIRGHAAEFRVDPAMVAVVGFSAGGHLCGCLGTMFDDPVVADIGPADMLRPDALGLCYPVVVSWGRTHEGSFDSLCGSDGALRASLSLEKRVRKDMMPVFLWHTWEDDTVPCRNSLLMAQALEEAGVPFVLHLYHKGCHGLSTADAQTYPAEEVPCVSWDVPGWITAQMEFFRELGFRIQDRKEKEA